MTESIRKLKEVLSKGAVGVLVILFILFGLKGCVLSLWTSPKEPISYSVEGADKRSFRVTFLPNQETMIWYVDPSKPIIEGVLTRMRGSYGTHYFWRLWHIDGPGVFFGYRIYPDDVEPVMMEIETLDKYVEGRGNSSFSNIGSTSHQVLLFGKNQMMYQNMWLAREAPNPQADLALRSKFHKLEK
jgi:hypothetical protein